jgi:hypothetical protein
MQNPGKFHDGCSAMIVESEKYEVINGSRDVTQYGSFCSCTTFNIEPLFFVASYGNH